MTKYQEKLIAAALAGLLITGAAVLAFQPTLSGIALAGRPAPTQIYDLNI